MSLFFQQVQRLLAVTKGHQPMTVKMGSFERMRNVMIAFSVLISVSAAGRKGPCPWPGKEHVLCQRHAGTRQCVVKMKPQFTCSIQPSGSWSEYC